MRKTIYTRGQTLLELIVVIAVVAIVLTALVAAVTAALRYGQASRFRSQGVKLAQEGLEIVRKERDTDDWTTFAAYASTNGGRWCLPDTGLLTADDGSGTCPVTAGETFWRLITFTWNGTDERMEIISRVSWGERNTQSTVMLETYLTQWK